MLFFSHLISRFLDDVFFQNFYYDTIFKVYALKRREGFGLLINMPNFVADYRNTVRCLQFEICLVCSNAR